MKAFHEQPTEAEAKARIYRRESETGLAFFANIDLRHSKAGNWRDTLLINMAGQYYPCCPQPDLTIGIASHTVPRVITVLLQDLISGLQVKHGNEWADVTPIPGALVVNIGDLLQVKFYLWKFTHPV
ncbi:1-aminocyclopropane-1-carboxylate oxidase homolog 5-like [Rhodamnia argentea]|uniref:1-aminocyclopropane-1-carboxylate oxidase homolog 5-like n=1 Tax=Rhodamnia argentea TaxID=178133 RepID=A0A8B8QWV6_9MYRT|nr:1-aminocyclopropane-1-carboxylate oxidase homolog 5-like [Rhodamnia argentea]